MHDLRQLQRSMSTLRAILSAPLYLISVVLIGLALSVGFVAVLIGGKEK